MKARFITIILALLVFNGTVAEIYNENEDCSENEESHKFIYETINFSEPTVIDMGNYVRIGLKEANSYLNEHGYPSLPVITKTFILPIGTKIISVDCKPRSAKEIKIDKKIFPAVGAIPLVKDYKIKIEENARIYNSFKAFPNKWYTHHIGVGVYNGENVIFLTIEVYPVRYCPASNMLEYAEKMEISIEYEKREIRIFNDAYDLVIIAPTKFSDSLLPLVEHKENHGIKTKLVTTEEIYANYNGRDDAEKIKYFIKDAKEQWGIKYVLLVGGMKGQRFKWYVPVRYSHLDDASNWENSYISDLYFADLYKYEDGVAFDDWDSNGNGIFAEWNEHSKDVLDLYPDVYIGRLPCRYKWEVKIMVNKIIEYENTAYGQEWFKRMVVIGGDSFPDQEFGTDYIEGQVECDYALSFMQGFEHVRVYVEGGDIEFTPENAEHALSEGEGFVYFSGHGNPASWATHPHNDFETWIDFGLKSIRKLSNENKLPVLVVGGCHNCQFNVSILRLLKEGIWAYYLGEATPECWGWLMTRHGKGGSIATIGNTGLGYGTIGDGPVDEVPDSVPDGIPDCIQYLGGWLEPHFFEVYSEGKDVLGEIWGIALTDYLNKFPIDWTAEWTDEKPYTIEQVDCKTVQEWVLLGDPSLKVGGYP